MMPVSVSSGLIRAHASGDAATIAALDALRCELAAREDRICVLEGLLGLRVPVLPKVRMPPTGRLIFGVLLKAKGFVAAETMLQAIWGHLPDCDWPSDPYATLKVHICKLRELLRPYGVSFETIFAAEGSGGYRMLPQMQARARDVICGEGAR